MASGEVCLGEKPVVVAVVEEGEGSEDAWCIFERRKKLVRVEIMARIQ